MLIEGGAGTERQKKGWLRFRESSEGVEIIGQGAVCTKV